MEDPCKFKKSKILIKKYNGCAKKQFLSPRNKENGVSHVHARKGSTTLRGILFQQLLAFLGVLHYTGGTSTE